MSRKLKQSEYEDIRFCIKTDQVPASQIVKYFEDKDFKRWYDHKDKKEYKRTYTLEYLT